jgi:hypothetical protein
MMRITLNLALSPTKHMMMHTDKQLVWGSNSQLLIELKVQASGS